MFSFLEKLFGIKPHQPVVHFSHVRGEPIHEHETTTLHQRSSQKRKRSGLDISDAFLPLDLRRPPKLQRQFPYASYLCDDCVNLDFESAFEEAEDFFGANRDLVLGLREWKNARKHFRGLKVADLGMRIKGTTARCRLCRFLASHISSFDESHEIRAFPLYWVLPFLKMDTKFFSVHDHRVQPSVFMVVPTAADQPLASRNFTQENCIFKYSEHDPESIVAKAPQPHVDLDSIREWIDFCEDHHSPSCPKRHTNAKGGTELRGFRVIDCNDETIVPSSLDQPFVALSYVWGQMREQISSKWPQVVIDAIEVTKTLGFRYLWVDRYCIDQDNADEKHDQITNMDTIYESAQLTIMAAAGKNAEYGLPGVARGRVVPRSLDLDGISVGALPRDVCQSVHSSVWWSRGWTYQEGVLSRRRLIFTDDQVYFQCHNMINYEIFDIPLNKFHLASRMSQRDLIRPCLFTGDSANQPSSKSQPSPQIKQDRLLYHIRNYSHRTLSYTSDGLNAFQGIISATQLRTFYGLIVSSRFPKSDQIFSKINACQSKDDGTLANFGDGMELAAALVSWWHETDLPSQDSQDKKLSTSLPMRLSEFPSWSWLGRRGVIHNTSQITKLQNKTTDYFEPDLAGPELSLFASTSRPFKTFYAHKEDLAALLEPVVRIYHGRRISNVQLGLGSPSRKSRKNAMLSNWHWYINGPTPLVLRFKLSVAITQRNLARDLRRGDIQVILMAKSNVDYVFLVVQSPHYVAYRRIGICLVDKRSIKKWVSKDRDAGSLREAILTPLLASIEIH